MYWRYRLAYFVLVCNAFFVCKFLNNKYLFNY